MKNNKYPYFLIFHSLQIEYAAGVITLLVIIYLVIIGDFQAIG